MRRVLAPPRSISMVIKRRQRASKACLERMIRVASRSGSKPKNSVRESSGPRRQSHHSELVKKEATIKL